MQLHCDSTPEVKLLTAGAVFVKLQDSALYATCKGADQHVTATKQQVIAGNELIHIQCSDADVPQQVYAPFIKLFRYDMSTADMRLCQLI